MLLILVPKRSDAAGGITRPDFRQVYIVRPFYRKRKRTRRKLTYSVASGRPGFWVLSPVPPKLFLVLLNVDFLPIFHLLLSDVVTFSMSRLCFMM